MDENWFTREMERTKKRVEAMPNGAAEVEYARWRAEELNRAEAEEYRIQQEFRKKLNAG